MVNNYKLVYTKQAGKDAKKLSNSGLKTKALELLEIISQNPYQNPLPYEKLIGDLNSTISKRINIQHRLVYEVLEDIKTIKVIGSVRNYVSI